MFWLYLDIGVEKSFWSLIFLKFLKFWKIKETANIWMHGIALDC